MSRRPGSTPVPARKASSGTVRASGCSRRDSTPGDVERILELVPIATHNQRGRQTLFVGTEQDLDAEVLVDIAERSMSAPIYDLLKRPDELFVVEHAHLQPRFVEDSVRHALRDALQTRFRNSTTMTSCSPSRSTSRRSTCTTSLPSASARSASCAASSRPAEPSTRQTTLAAWLSRLTRAEPEAVLGAAEEPADVLVVQGDDR